MASDFTRSLTHASRLIFPKPTVLTSVKRSPKNKTNSNCSSKLKLRLSKDNKWNKADSVNSKKKPSLNKLLLPLPRDNDRSNYRPLLKLLNVNVSVKPQINFAKNKFKLLKDFVNSKSSSSNN